MSSSNRELVIDFVSYKLSQKGYSWSQLEEEDENRTDFAAEEAEMDGVLNGSPSWHPPASHVVNGAAVHRSSLEVHEIVQAADVRQALREAGDEFELRYRRAFSDLTSQLHITPGTAYQSFEQERFVDLYGNNAAAEVRKGQETFNKWLLTGATVAGVLLLGSLLSRK
ncbi:PREDICTED: bcl-2-like protein 1 isoform X2 [Nipponia nippon]|uniref:bcl-2-like protein 1 isoform X2 n=1 Tax=Nipponia nippon TaxID=128390 RepID=UPI00051147E6|nr:PREDICTED: bcl-2-like protein 1 isoform X2 [Nipponia nippon]